MIRRMVADLDFAVEIEVLPDRPRARRAGDELAERLPRRRASASAPPALQPGAGAVAHGAPPRASATSTEVLAAAAPSSREAGIEPEYLEARDAATLAADARASTAARSWSPWPPGSAGPPDRQLIDRIRNQSGKKGRNLMSTDHAYPNSAAGERPVIDSRGSAEMKERASRS